MTPQPTFRPVERLLIQGGKALVVVALGAAVWTVLILAFLLQGGIGDAFRAVTTEGRPGPLTIAVVWPLLGLLWVLGEALGDGLLEAATEGLARLKRFVRWSRRIQPVG